jgi:hypothetical protein
VQGSIENLRCEEAKSNSNPSLCEKYEWNGTIEKEKKSEPSKRWKTNLYILKRIG